MRNNAENISNHLLWQDSQPTDRAMHIADAHIVGSEQGRAKVELLDFRAGRQKEKRRDKLNSLLKNIINVPEAMLFILIVTRRMKHDVIGIYARKRSSRIKKI